MRRRRVAVLRQQEQAECGLACMAMVAGFWGYETDLTSLRLRFPTRGVGITVRDLVAMAAQMALEATPLQVPIGHVRRTTMPAIAHWNMNHFVVLESAGRNAVSVVDPAMGRTAMSWAEFGKHYTGVLLALTPGEDFRRAKQRSKLRLSDLWGKLVAVKRSAVQIGTLSLVMQLFVVASPLFLQVVVDEVLATDRGDMLVGLAAGFSGLVLINAASQALRGYVLARTGGLLSLQAGRNLFAHLLKLPVSYFERRSLGGIESRFYSIEPIQRALTEGVTSSVVDGLFAVVSVACMLLYSVALTGVALASVTAYVLIRLLTYSRNRALQEASIVSMADRRTFFAETLRGVTALKLLGAEESREATWLRKSTKAVNDMLRLRILRIGFDGAVAVVFGMEFVVLVTVAATSVQAGAMTTGMMFAFLAFRTNFGDRSVALIEELFEFRMLRLHLDRMADVALERPEDHMPDTSSSEVRGRLECRDVAFRYGDEGPLVLEDVSFAVGPGESVAIVGPSGSGKTTLLKLMLGLLEPSAGGILVDGEPLDRTTVRHFRRHVGVVMQHDQLFGGTIRENIAGFVGEVDEERTTWAAKTAHIHEDIVALPMGYGTFIGTIGSMLSGGQIQRVLLARALYRKPRIVFMDEGTAHLDLDLEGRVTDSLGRLGVTRVIVTHRPATIAKVDQVVEVGRRAGG